jgi:predicted nucleic acid-binding protein
VERDRTTLVLDSGALISLSRGSAQTRSRIEAARRRGATILVPVVTIAETHRGSGPREALLNLALARLEPPRPLGDSTARIAGVLLAESGSSSTIDALVVAEAIEMAPAVILTSDPKDLQLLVGARRDVVVTQV